MNTNTLQEIADDILFRLSRPRIREIQGFRMWINTKEPSYSFRKTLRYYDKVEAHEPSTTKIFKKIVKQGNVVVDIGANMGYFSLLAKSLGAEVYAYEPEPKSYGYLVKNAEINNYNITARSSAISNILGKERFYFCSYDSGHHTLKQNKGIKDYRKTSLIRKCMDLFQKKYIDIFTTTLDDEIKERVDVIKMDCEGSELLAIKGMSRILMENKDLKMIIEFFPLLLEKMGSNPKDLFDILNNRFKIYIIPNDYSAQKGLRVDSYLDLMKHLTKVDSHLNLFLTK